MSRNWRDLQRGTIGTPHTRARIREGSPLTAILDPLVRGPARAKQFIHECGKLSTGRATATRCAADVVRHRSTERQDTCQPLRPRNLSLCRPSQSRSGARPRPNPHSVVASDARDDLYAIARRLTDGAGPGSSDNQFVENDRRAGRDGATGAAPLRATLADLFGEPHPSDPEWCARQAAHSAYVEGLLDALPDPEYPWQPGDFGRLIWDREQRRPRLWLCDPNGGEFLTDAAGARMPGHCLADQPVETPGGPIRHDDD